MLVIKNVFTIQGNATDYAIPSETEQTIDGEGRLTVLPALIDPHVHFRTPGAEHKEDWIAGAKAAIAGGVTTVLDMPNNTPSCITTERLHDKQAYIEKQLATAGIPLRYGLYLGADKRHLDDIATAKKGAAGLKIFMGSSTGDLLMDDPQCLDEAFHLAAEANMVVAVHAEDEARMRSRAQQFPNANDPATHSIIRDPQSAANALSLAIGLAKKHGTRLYALHLSTAEEMALVRQAKADGIDVFAETTPHHLFLNLHAYATHGGQVQVNPPLRHHDNCDALWEAIADGTIDTIGSDHAPHTLEEKNVPYPNTPSGIPGIETTLPLLLNSCHEGRLDLGTIARLTRWNTERLFGLSSHNDMVLVDLDEEQEVDNSKIHSKCGWSPFAGQRLHGWPVYTILRGQVFDVKNL